MHMNIYKSCTRNAQFVYKTTQMDKELHDKIIEIDQRFIGHYYQQDTITCDICQPNREPTKYYKKNAKFSIKDYGINLECRRCKRSYPLNKYLQEAHKDHRGHAIARWEIDSTGWNFNCPHPPKDFLDEVKRKRREEYKKQEDNLKKQNYLKKYGRLP